MDRVIELMSMPYMQMSILNRIELAFHIGVIIIIFAVLVCGLKKAFDE